MLAGAAEDGEKGALTFENASGESGFYWTSVCRDGWGGMFEIRECSVQGRV